jgi:ATP-dependent DNA helicase RecG
MMKKGWFFDSQISEATTGDINRKKFRWFLKTAVKAGRLKIKPGADIETALKRLGLIADGRLRNAAALMFCDKPAEFQLNAEIRCGWLRGSELTSPYIELKSFSGPLFEQIDKSEEFISNILRRRSRRSPEYPLNAVKEAVVNAVAHRDYMMASPSQVRIFDDRAEVVSPGGLPEGLNVRKMRARNTAVPRNPLIARLLYYIKYMNLRGTGTTKIENSCRKYSLPTPEFEDADSSFMVRFRKHKLTSDLLHKIGAHERHVRAMDYIKVVKKLSHEEYQKLANTSQDVAKKDLMHLVRKGVLKKVEEGDVSYYVLAQ